MKSNSQKRLLSLTKQYKNENICQMRKKKESIHENPTLVLQIEDIRGEKIKDKSQLELFITMGSAFFTKKTFNEC